MIAFKDQIDQPIKPPTATLQQLSLKEFAKTFDPQHSHLMEQLIESIPPPTNLTIPIQMVKGVQNYPPKWGKKLGDFHLAFHGKMCYLTPNTFPVGIQASIISIHKPSPCKGKNS